MKLEASPVLWVAVLAHNERATIAAVVRALRQQRLPAGRRVAVVVCANACTDGTELEVEREFSGDPSVALLVIPQRGKIAAIQKAVEFVSQQAGITGAAAMGLADADIELPDTSVVQRLNERLDSAPDLWLACACPLARVSADSAGWLIRGIVRARAEANHIARVNMVRGQLILARLCHLLENPIPADAVSDDMYLAHAFKGHFLMDHDAIVYTEGKSSLRAEIRRTTFLVAAREVMYRPGGTADFRPRGAPTAREEWSPRMFGALHLLKMMVRYRAWRTLFFLLCWAPFNSYCERAGRSIARRAASDPRRLEALWTTRR